MPDVITSNFDLQAPFPIETSMQVQSINDRNSINEFKRWEGMQVYVIDEQTTYRLTGGIQNSQWVAMTAGAPEPGNFIPMGWVQTSADLDFQSDQRIPTAAAVRDYVASISPGAQDLQSVTVEGNITDRAIHVTGDEDFDIDTDGLAIRSISGNSQVMHIEGGETVGLINFDGSTARIGTASGAGNGLIIQDNGLSIFRNNSSVLTRVSGAEATQPENFVTLSQLDDYQPLSEKGEANGYAPLDGNGNVPLDNISNRVFRTGGSEGALLGFLGAVSNDLNNFIGARATILGQNVQNMPISGVEGALINLFESPERSPQIWISSVPNDGTQSAYFRGRQGNDWLKLADERYGIGTVITQDSELLNQVENTGLYMAPESDPDRPPQFLSSERIPYINISFLSSRTQISARACETACGSTPGPYFFGYRGKDNNDNWSQWVRAWDQKNLVAPFANSWQSKYMPNEVSKNGVWNQWIEPLAIRDSEGSLWIGSVGANSEIYITKQYQDGRIIRRQIGSILTNLGGLSTDDHNAPCILLDDRTGADYPVIIFQCDHNTTPIRYWRFNTLDLTQWDVSSWDTIPDNQAYVQASRFGDEIFVWSRTPTLPRPWRVSYSADNGDTWTTRTIFSTPASWLYLFAKVKLNGSGLNIAMHGHPLNSSNQNIYFLELDFASGEVVNPADRGNPVIPDIRAAIADTSFTPVDPFEEGLALYTAQGTEITRLWDVSRNNDGQAIVLFNVSPSNESTMANFFNSTYTVVGFDLDDGSIVHTTNIEEAGMPIENPKGDNFYFAGGCVIDANNVTVCTWKNASMQRSGINGDNIEYDFGQTVVRRIQISSSGSSISKVVLRSGNQRKIIRPVASDLDTVVFAEAEYYDVYSNYSSDLIIRYVSN